VLEHGGQEFRELLAKAVSFIDFKAKQFQRSGAFATAEGKTEAVRSLVQSIAKMKDELKRNFYVKEVSEKYDVYESLLFRELEQVLKQENRIIRSGGYVKSAVAQQVTKSEKGISSKSRPVPPEERDILKLILEGNPGVIRYLLSNISILQLTDEQMKKLAQLVLDLYDERGPIDAPSIVNVVQEPELKNLITDLVLSRYELSRGWQQMEREIDEPDPMMIARDAIITLRRKSIHKEMEENQKALKEASIMQSDTKPYLVKQQELLEALKKLELLRT
jgi:DNA primase